MLPSENRLRRKSDFNYVYKRGKSLANRYLVIYYVKRRNHFTRIGFSVSKKLGNAVERNKIKRVLREVCRRNISRFVSGYDIVFIARYRVKNLDYNNVERKLIELSKKAKVLK